MEKNKKIQDFINFINHAKLSRQQQIKRDKLMAREISMTRDFSLVNNFNLVPLEGNKPSAENHRLGLSCEYLSPKNLVSFLYQFNQDEVLKYTCHQIDSEETITHIKSDCKTSEYNLTAHYKLISDKFDCLVNSFNDVDLTKYKIYYLIKAFIKGGNTWSEGKYEYSWNCKELFDWAEKNKNCVPNPGATISSKQKKYFRFNRPITNHLTGEIIDRFDKLTILFKKLFHLRHNNPLKELIENKNNDKCHPKISNMEISFSKNWSSTIDLFIDVDKLLQAYVKIIEICNDNSESHKHKQIELSLYEEGSDFVIFSIFHKDSTYGRSIDSIDRIGADHGELIKNQINGLCDLHIEAKFGDGKSYRFNLWDEHRHLEKKDIEAINGVKYLMKFHRKPN